MANTAVRVCYALALMVAVVGQECDEKDIETELRVIVGSSLPTPIAISARTFMDVLRNGNIFVDKSLWLNQIFREKWDGTCPVFTFARPTGMGKSVMMDMVRIFAEAKIVYETDEVLPPNQTLGYKIFQLGEIPMGNGEVRKMNKPPMISELTDVMEQHQGRYIVLFANFSDLKPRNIEEVKRGIGQRIHKTIEKFDFDRIEDNVASGSSDSTMKELADSFLTDDWEWNSFARIWIALAEYFKREVVVMIDGFDEPMVEVLLGPPFNLTEVVDPVVNFYEEIYYLIDRNNATFRRFIMTSTIRMGFEDMYSNYDLFNEMMGEIVYHSFGFKQNEVNAICDHIGIPKSISSKLVYHYGGYHTSSNEESTFLPTSIAKFAVRRKIENFWKPRSSFEQLFDIYLDIPEFRQFLHNVTLDLCGTKGPYTVHNLIITCTSEGFLQQLSQFLEDNNSIYRDPHLREDIMLVAKVMSRSAGILSRLNEIPNEEVEMYVRAKLLACGP